MSMSQILAAIRELDDQTCLIEAGDCIAVGVSGGKDSSLLLLALHRYQQYRQIPFQIIGIHIDPFFQDHSVQPLVDFFASLSIPLHVLPSTPSIASVLPQHLTPNGLYPCSICSKLRTAAMNQAAKALGCNKIAFAHHHDDALETLMLNAIHGGTLAPLPAKRMLSRSQLTIIRPLLFAKESTIEATTRQLGIPFCPSKCPTDGHTERAAMKSRLQALYQEYPQARANLRRVVRTLILQAEEKES